MSYVTHVKLAKKHGATVVTYCQLIDEIDHQKIAADTTKLKQEKVAKKKAADVPEFE